MITGEGTGGHITGCAEILKQHYPNLKVFAVEPEASPVISGGAWSPSFKVLAQDLSQLIYRTSRWELVSKDEAY
jgi:cysteine synthase